MKTKTRIVILRYISGKGWILDRGDRANKIQIINTSIQTIQYTT